MEDGRAGGGRRLPPHFAVLRLAGFLDGRCCGLVGPGLARAGGTVSTASALPPGVPEVLRQRVCADLTYSARAATCPSLHSAVPWSDPLPPLPSFGVCCPECDPISRSRLTQGASKRSRHSENTGNLNVVLISIPSESDGIVI